MAVFTEVPFAQAELTLRQLELGKLQSLQGISSGIENTNYFATTDRGEFVLTLFEKLQEHQLPYFLKLMKHLAARGIPVPDPQPTEQGELQFRLCDRPAALVSRLSGQVVTAPTTHHCSSVGAMLARMHLAGCDFPLRQPNFRGLAWWRATVPEVLPFLTPGQRNLLESELAYQEDLAAGSRFQALPRGPIHADLFRDNVMFEGDRLCGFFDFYFAGDDTFLFDVAVCLNDWCVDLSTGQLDEHRARAFCEAYQTHRAFDDAESALLRDLLRAAALRFWLSRLWDLHRPRRAALLKPHDPRHFERILLGHRDSPRLAISR